MHILFAFTSGILPQVAIGVILAGYTPQSRHAAEAGNVRIQTHYQIGEVVQRYRQLVQR